MSNSLMNFVGCIGLLVLGACGSEGLEATTDHAQPPATQSLSAAAACGGKLVVSARTWREGTLCRAAAGMRFTGIFSPPPRINLSGWACVNGQCASPQWGPREGNGAWWDAYAEAPALANCAWMSAAIAASIDAPSYCPPGDNRASASDSQ